MACGGVEGVAGFCALAGFVWESGCDPEVEAPTVSVDFCTAETESVALVDCSGSKEM